LPFAEESTKRKPHFPQGMVVLRAIIIQTLSCSSWKPGTGESNLPCPTANCLREQRTHDTSWLLKGVYILHCKPPVLIVQQKVLLEGAVACDTRKVNYSKDSVVWYATRHCQLWYRFISLVHNFQSSAHLPVTSTPAALLEGPATTVSSLGSGELRRKKDR
jgi:hypothetical protein